ncbi:wsv430 [White spot syndrome virus]|uniref:Wsv430 n=4 Tax=White spot syndrome virus TaxID=342409 RepID=Q8VAI3_WSSVS|nr:wsv430 [Shrimp white spot syndrome virus]AFX59807.1 wsv430 [White spot syndrome virus]AAL33432.1 wsv430 [Shrimp white spot syndrome virus]AAL89357.1 WSSV489 [Shrimp white spot syndrome virus]AWQ60554.1 wsv430 [Shrimp white spot syndrome virus]AWQ60996.1 wsv430 [Shrimp white spot syndrome virus]
MPSQSSSSSSSSSSLSDIWWALLLLVFLTLLPIFLYIFSIVKTLALSALSFFIMFFSERSLSTLLCLDT